MEDVEKEFGNEKYIFTCDESGQTVIERYEQYDNTFNQVVQNVAIGTGVVLICATVSVVSAGVGVPAVSVIFAAAAKTGTVMAVQSAAIGAAITATVTGIQTHDVNETLKQTALSASQDFKFGAILGVATGGTRKDFSVSQSNKGWTDFEINLNPKRYKIRYPLEFSTSKNFLLKKLGFVWLFGAINWAI